MAGGPASSKRLGRIGRAQCNIDDAGRRYIAPVCARDAAGRRDDPAGAIPTPNKTVPTPDKTVPTPDKTVPTRNKTVPTRNKTVPTPDKTVPIRNKTVPPPDKTVPTPDKTVPTPDKTVTTPNKTIPTRNKTVTIRFEAIARGKEGSTRRATRMGYSDRGASGQEEAFRHRYRGVTGRSATFASGLGPLESAQVQAERPPRAYDLRVSNVRIRPRKAIAAGKIILSEPQLFELESAN